MSYDPQKSKWAPQVHTYGETELRGSRTLVYGESGSGKTTLAATWPKPFFIDLDLGENEETRQRKLNYIYLKPRGIFTTLKALLEDFLMRRDIFDQDGGPQADRETIVIDTWTKVNTFILADLCGSAVGAKSIIDVANDRPTIAQYGFLASRQDAIVSILKEISMQGRHVVITCLPMVEGSEEEKKTASKSSEMKTTYEDVVGIPNLVGKFKWQIGAEFDEQYYLRQADQGPQRYLHTQRYGIWRAKTRRKMPAVITNPTYESLMASR